MNLSMLWVGVGLLSAVQGHPSNVTVEFDKRQAQPFPLSGFCKNTGLKASDGTQLKGGSCSSTPQGSIPSVDRMVSTLILNPANGANLDASKDNVVTIDTKNLQTGFFSDPNKQYYLIPQSLNGQGVIQGHQHISVQALGGANAAPDAQAFVFFKGLNEAAVGNKLSVSIPAKTLKQNGIVSFYKFEASQFNSKPRHKK